MKIKLRYLAIALASIVVVLPMGIGAALLSIDHLESQPNFCNSCHLPSGTVLHKFKMKAAREQRPRDLTGIHFRKAHRVDSNREPFVCADCHRGTGWRGRGTVLWDSFANTVQYVFSSYEEPESITNPISDITCLGCHPQKAFEPSKQRFHGMNAHKGLTSIVLCTDCHLGHTQDESRALNIVRMVAASKENCGRCHKGEPLAPPVTALLERYKQWLER